MEVSAIISPSPPPLSYIDHLPLDAESMSSSLPSPPIASLSQLPLKKVLTVNMDVPEPWLVEPQKVKDEPISTLLS